MTTFDENGESRDSQGNLEIDPTHLNYLTDRRYDLVRQKWARARGAASREEASANAER